MYHNRLNTEVVIRIQLPFRPNIKAICKNVNQFNFLIFILFLEVFLLQKSYVNK